MVRVESEDIESSILNQFFGTDISKAKGYSKATVWAKALAKLNEDEKALDKINELSGNVFLGQNIHSVEELAMSMPSQKTMHMRIGGDEYKVTTNQIYEELDKYYTDILTVVAMMYIKDEFSEKYMISSHDKAKDIESDHEYTENE